MDLRFLGNNRRHRRCMSGAYTLFWFPFEAELIVRMPWCQIPFSFVQIFFLPFGAACGVARRG